MPRYKLRTLLIALALGPPLLAGLWLLRDVRPAFAIGWAFMLWFFLANRLPYYRTLHESMKATSCRRVSFEHFGNN